MILKSKVVVEIGTSTGMSSIAILQGLTEGKLTTFDLSGWGEFNSHLQKELFGNHFEQVLLDLAKECNFERYRNLLNQADYIFIDGPKNSIFKYEFSKLLTILDRKAQKLLILVLLSAGAVPG
jgi:predicted O-methyltransferase YrrM